MTVVFCAACRVYAYEMGLGQLLGFVVVAEYRITMSTGFRRAASHTHGSTDRAIVYIHVSGRISYRRRRTRRRRHYTKSQRRRSDTHSAANSPFDDRHQRLRASGSWSPRRLFRDPREVWTLRHLSHHCSQLARHESTYGARHRETTSPTCLTILCSAPSQTLTTRIR